MQTIPKSLQNKRHTMLFRRPFSTMLPFIAASGIMLIVTHRLIPYLSNVSGQEPIIFWFIAGGWLIFLPLLLSSYFVLDREMTAEHTSILANLKYVWVERLRFRAISRQDLFWALSGIISIGILGLVCTLVIRAWIPNSSLHPDFMSLAPLTTDRYWILGLWLPFWILNIWGEEILWRGLLLPIQEQHFGKYAWVLNTLGWLLFHIAFGSVLLITLLPILVIVPWMVQKRQNSWIGVIIHAGINGPGFLAVAFGFV
ncbi:MAG: CPBP family intramembrane metalloprotease [Candidatus Kapabacteria bacterium]|nr:CPBP family intramembrane metalloprotease [Candidatus Kapabacteria bacterium]